MSMVCVHRAGRLVCHNGVGDGGQEVRRAGAIAGQWGLDVVPTWEPLKVLQQKSSLVKVVLLSVWGVSDGAGVGGGEGVGAGSWEQMDECELTEPGSSLKSHGSQKNHSLFLSLSLSHL